MNQIFNIFALNKLIFYQLFEPVLPKYLNSCSTVLISRYSLLVGLELVLNVNMFIS